MKNIRIILGATILSLGLSGCQDTKKALGFSKTVPDENTVIERAPLTVPDNLELRPPRTGDAEEVWDAREKARDQILGATQKSKDLSGGEKALLMQAGVDKADPEIRQQLKKQPVKADKADVLNAEKEAAKLQKPEDKKTSEEVPETEAE